MLECIPLYNQNSIFIAFRKMKLERMDDNKYEIYNYDSNVTFTGTDVGYIFLDICLAYLCIDLLIKFE